MLIDTHAHLNFRDYRKDLDEVINRAVENGVEKIICVSSNIVDSKKAIKLAKQHPGTIYAAVGIHPHQTDPENQLTFKQQIKKLTEMAGERQIVAIGECGLDYSPAPPGEKDRLQEEQVFLFKEQIKLAQKLKLPILVHSRQAFPETLEILKSSIINLKSPLSGVFHCYSAGKKGIQPVSELGFYFGFDGNLTYDEGLQNVARQIPLEKILLETDCPNLSPEPFRSQRNEPKNVKIITECLAKVKGISFEKVCQTTSQNAKKLLKI